MEKREIERAFVCSEEDPKRLEYTMDEERIEKEQEWREKNVE